MLSQSDGAITIPNSNTFEKEVYIYKIIEKILRIKKIKYKFKKKVKKFDKNILQIELKNQKNHGQKNYEIFKEQNEVVKVVHNDQQILILPFTGKKNISNTFLKYKDYSKLKLFFKRKFRSYNPTKNIKKVSKEL